MGCFLLRPALWSHNKETVLQINQDHGIRLGKCVADGTNYCSINGVRDWIACFVICRYFMHMRGNRRDCIQSQLQSHVWLEFFMWKLVYAYCWDLVWYEKWNWHFTDKYLQIQSVFYPGTANKNFLDFFRYLAVFIMHINTRKITTG